MGTTERLVLCARDDFLREIRPNYETEVKQLTVLELILFSQYRGIIENVGQENEDIQETVENEIPTPIVIEKAKKPRKKRESNSPAQLETLRRGREHLAEKRKKRLEEKINEPLNKLDEVYDMCDRVLKRLD